MDLPRLDLDTLRREIVGADASIETPFGRRPMTYADYTASGRCLGFVERFLLRVQRLYANTHTEDDVSGRSMSRLLHQAEQAIKDGVHAGPGGKLIAVGSGCTAAIDKFQQILGVQLPPATARLLTELARASLGEGMGRFEEALRARRPVVFLGPFEHHSNEITWRQSLAEVVPVRLGADGGIDLAHLAALLAEPRYLGRLRIGSFSAASNVTGRLAPVGEIARLLHAHDALACFDYAACAPYVRIDMNPAPGPEGGDPSLDAVFLSPHKFLGGPGSSGVLVFQERLYPAELPPTVAGGGTVDYVGPHDHDFLRDVEEREKAGTPGVLQTMKAALAFLVKDAVGIERIEAREHELLARAMERWAANSAVEILGDPDPSRRCAIVSFNVRDPRGPVLHPKFLTVLLNDLFGVQSRAGCSCAGPYGHALLGIDEATSERYREQVRQGWLGIKPGWCRVGLHYAMDEAEVGYLVEAVDFVAREGWRFLPLYDFDLRAATWSHRERAVEPEDFELAAALRLRPPEPELGAVERRRQYAHALAEAERLAGELAAAPAPPLRRLEGELGELQFFSL